MYSDETRSIALDLLADGMSIRDVAEVFGGKPSKSTISQWKHGIEPRGRKGGPRKVFSLETKLSAIERMERGESYKAIAADIGCTPNALLGWRSKYLEFGEDGIRTARDIRLALQRRARTERLGGDAHVQ